MTTLSLSVPTVGQPNSTEDVKVANDFTTLQAWANGSIDGANLDASLPGRRLIMQTAIGMSGLAATTQLMNGASDAVLSGTGGTNRNIAWAYLDPAGFAVVNRTTKLILRASLAVNSTAPAASFAAQLGAVTFTGGSGGLVPTAGATVSGSGLTFSTPAANAIVVSETAAFTFPTAGAYAPNVVISPGMNAASVVGITFQLFVLNS